MGVRTRRARKHSKTHFIGFGAAGILGFLALLGIALAVSLGTLVDSWLEDLPDYTSADAYLVAEPTQVYDADGNLIAEFYLQNRRSVTEDEVSPYVLEGTVAVEDERFYQHNGVDPQGVIRAAVGQLFGGSEGASTITQQLVRNTVLSDEQFEISLKRKVREAYIAIQMEKMYTKDQILMMYLNTIYYGNGAYGIEAASITYFNKHASELTLNEAATLIGIPNSPSYYDPTVNMDACKSRRDLVLRRMLSNGVITQEEYDQTVGTDITLNLGNSVMDENGTYPYFTAYIKELLQQDFDSDTIFQGGLQVYTTLDPASQQAAEEAVQETLNDIGDDSLEAALVAIDPDTGYVKAMIGGRDFNANQFNLATQARRQAGSSFKAFTLAAAIGDGMNPQIYLNCNSPIQASSTWRVQNYANTSYGTITLARATEYSSNTGYAQVAQAIGAQKIVDTAKAMGIDEDLPAYESLTLGVIGIPPIQMAEAYATLASGGVHHDAVAITKIEDRNGNTVYEHQDNPTQALTAEVAHATTQVLSGVVNHSGGTATAVLNYTNGVDQPIAGKTGTTENARDLWFCGYTPQISVAVWVGYREEAPVYVYGSEGHPSNTACPIFGRYVAKTLAGTPREEFPEAADPEYKPNSSWTFSATKSQSDIEEDRKAEEKEDKKEEEKKEETKKDQNSSSSSDNSQSTETPETPSTGDGGSTGETPSNPGQGGDTSGGDETGTTTPPAESGTGIAAFLGLWYNSPLTLPWLL